MEPELNRDYNALPKKNTLRKQFFAGIAFQKACYLARRRLAHRRSLTPPPPVAPVPAATTPSLFLTVLPQLIRELIYHFVFASLELHLSIPRFSVKGKPPPRLLYYDIGSDVYRSLWYGWRARIYSHSRNDPYLAFRWERSVTGQLLGLALCCRQVYVLFPPSLIGSKTTNRR